MTGLEPATRSFRGPRSAVELHGHCCGLPGVRLPSINQDPSRPDGLLPKFSAYTIRGETLAYSAEPGHSPGPRNHVRPSRLELPLAPWQGAVPPLHHDHVLLEMIPGDDDCTDTE